MAAELFRAELQTAVGQAEEDPETLQADSEKLGKPLGYRCQETSIELLGRVWGKSRTVARRELAWCRATLLVGVVPYQGPSQSAGAAKPGWALSK